MAVQYDQWPVDDGVYGIIGEAAHEFGVPFELMLPVGGLESGFRPSARGDRCADLGLCDRGGHDDEGFCSFGLYQFNRCGGAGTNHAIADLLDARYNARLAAWTMRYRYDATGSWWEALQPWSTRPAAWALYEQYGDWAQQPPGTPVSGGEPPSGTPPAPPHGQPPVGESPFGGTVTVGGITIPKRVAVAGGIVAGVIMLDILFQRR